MLLIPSLKKKTKHQDILSLPDPPLFYLPLGSYAGDMQVQVAEGQQVQMYQQLAASTGPMSAKVHAPVSGTIVGITEISGDRFLTLQNDFRYTAQQLSPPDVDAIGSAEFLAILEEAAVEGSGGARFPTHLKYNIAPRTLDTLIVNGAECEPYLSADYLLMKTACDKLMRVLQLVQRVLAPRKIVFAIERQHRELEKLLLQAAKSYSLTVSVTLLPNTYPQGGELQVIKSVTGLEIAKGTIPAKHGLLVSNVGTLWAMHDAFFAGKPYTERIVTLSGNRSKTLGNYLVKIGTPVGHLLAETGNAWDSDRHSIITGGPMMGRAAQSPLTPIHKGVGGVLLLEHTNPKAMNCIACGYCVDVCPQRLMPLEFVRHNQEGDLAQLKSYHLDDCIACGACAYACPSDVPLMYHIQSGKAKLQQERRNGQS